MAKFTEEEMDRFEKAVDKVFGNSELTDQEVNDAADQLMKQPPRKVTPIPPDLDPKRLRFLEKAAELTRRTLEKNCGSEAAEEFVKEHKDLFKGD